MKNLPTVVCYDKDTPKCRRYRAKMLRLMVLVAVGGEPGISTRQLWSRLASLIKETDIKRTVGTLMDEGLIKGKMNKRGYRRSWNLTTSGCQHLRSTTFRLQQFVKLR